MKSHGERKNLSTWPIFALNTRPLSGQLARKSLEASPAAVPEMPKNCNGCSGSLQLTDTNNDKVRTFRTPKYPKISREASAAVTTLGQALIPAPLPCPPLPMDRSEFPGSEIYSVCTWHEPLRWFQNGRKGVQCLNTWTDECHFCISSVPSSVCANCNTTFLRTERISLSPFVTKRPTRNGHSVAFSTTRAASHNRK